MAAVLLDTNAIIFVAGGRSISPIAHKAIVAVALDGDILVSPISAWEIGMLAAKGRLTLAPDPNTWFRDFLARDGVRLAPLAPEDAIASLFLPAPAQGDPADRLLIATARALNVPLITRDAGMLAYAAAGHVKAIGC